MSSVTILFSLLSFHLMGLVVMAGTTFIDFITHRTFWKIYDVEKQPSKNLLQLMSRFSRLAGIGAAVIILTGFGMMAVTRGAFGEQFWFRIKFILVIILVLNAVLVGRIQGLKLRRLAADPGLASDEGIRLLKSRLNRFYLSQMILFIIIIILSVFKFN